MSSIALVARDLVKSYGDRRVLDGVSLTGVPGRRLGLVGENGVGKSTLLRLLAGSDEPDVGTVRRPDDLGFLHQEMPLAAGTVQSMIDEALTELRAAQRRLTELAARLERCPDDADVLLEYGDVLEWAQAHDVWAVDHRVETVLAGLGLDGVHRSRSLETLSGGQRARLGLAALLLRQPSALLLDEPTNHLDDPAMSFLERHLAAMPGVVVLASHDRVFLDEVCTDIVDLDPHLDGVARHRGTFSDYLLAKRAERFRWEQRYAEEQDELKRLRYSVNVTARQVSHGAPMGNTSKLAYDYKGGRVQKQVSRRVRDAQQRLAELTADQVSKPPRPLRFSGAVTGKPSTSEVVVQLRETCVANRLRVDELDLFGTDQLLVTGLNGAGKSTLLRVIAGKLAPDSGSVSSAGGLRVRLLEQDVVFPDPTNTPRRIYAKACGDGAPGLAELGLLPPNDLERPVGALSVGQRRRLALATLVANPPDVLLLDEPTNHVSLTLAAELEDALRQALGAVVVASHDRWLRSRWHGRVLTLDEGEVVHLT